MKYFFAKNLFDVNPVTLREMRQMVRSRIVSSGLTLFLMFQLIAVAFAIIMPTSAYSHTQKGGHVIFAVNLMLVFALLLGIPIFIHARMSAERNSDNLDLQFTTAIKPVQFVDGKAASAFILILLFAGTSLPFMMLAYILGGVDVFDILTGFSTMVACSICVTYFMLAAGSLLISRVFRTVVLIILLNFMFPFCIGIMSFSSSGGIGGTNAKIVFLCLAVMASACLLLRAICTAILSPRHANRDMPLRRLVLSLWAAWGVAASCFAACDAEAWIFYAWGSGFTFLFLLFVLVSLSTADSSGHRVLCDVSRRPFIRRLQFPLFSGWENGVVFGITSGFISILCAYAVSFIVFPGETEDNNRFAMTLLSLFSYVIAYTVTIRVLWNVFLHRISEYRTVGIISVVLMFAMSIIPPVINAAGNDNAAMFWPGAVSGVFDKDLLQYHLIVSAVWCGIVLVLLSKYIRDGFNRFRRPETAGCIPGEEK